MAIAGTVIVRVAYKVLSCKVFSLRGDEGDSPLGQTSFETTLLIYYCTTIYISVVTLKLHLYKDLNSPILSGLV